MNWAQLVKLFLTRYFLPGCPTKPQHDIASFTQQEDETLYEAWERYKDLLRYYPQHGLLGWMEVKTFYQGLTPSVRQTINAIAGGVIGNKAPEEARQPFDGMGINSYQWTFRGKIVNTAGIFEVDGVTALAAQVESLSKKINGMMSPRVASLMFCETCIRGYPTNDCPIVGASMGQL